MYFSDMATVASQVILHPYVSQSLKFGSFNVGRDKVLNLIVFGNGILIGALYPVALPHSSVFLSVSRLVSRLSG